MYNNYQNKNILFYSKQIFRQVEVGKAAEKGIEAAKKAQLKEQEVNTKRIKDKLVFLLNNPRVLSDPKTIKVGMDKLGIDYKDENVQKLILLTKNEQLLKFLASMTPYLSIQKAILKVDDKERNCYSTWLNENKKIHPDVMVALCKNYYRFAENAMEKNHPSFSPAVLDKLVDIVIKENGYLSDEFIGKAVEFNKLKLSHVNKLIDSDVNEKVKVAALKYKEIPLTVLNKLVNDKSVLVKSAVAAHPNASVGLLRTFASQIKSEKRFEKQEELLLAGMFSNPKCPKDIIQKFGEPFKDKNLERIMEKEEIASAMNLQWTIEVEAALAGNPNTPKSYLDIIFKHLPNIYEHGGSDHKTLYCGVVVPALRKRTDLTPKQKQILDKIKGY